MESKSGILIVVSILDVLLFLAAILFGVFFGIKNSAVFAENTYNLFACIACFGAFVIASACTITARNACITADNTYDLLRHVELLVKKEGISLSDLALRDQKTAAKIAKQLESEKIKMEKEQAKLELEKLKEQQETAQFEEAVEQEAPSDDDDDDDDIEEVQPEEEQAEEPIPEPAQEEPAVVQDVNLGIDYAEWKSALEGIVFCGECNNPMSVRQAKTASGMVVALCENAKNGKGCSQTKAISVSSLAKQFLDWFEAFYAERPEYFSIEDFKSKVEKVTIKDGNAAFIAKE